jgi:glycosyltransferase involved in cell wall biosynthesis
MTMVANSRAMPDRPETSRFDTAGNGLRLGLVCDFLEEHWPSMDLVGDMLARHLQEGHFQGLQAEQLRPRLRARFSRLPLIGCRGIFRNADRLINRFADYPNWLRGRAEAFDVFHLVDHSYSQLLHCLPAAHTVVTCHDLDTFRCLLEPQAEARPRWFQAMARRILDGFQKAAHIIAVSESTRKDLLRFQLFPADRITVIPNGVHPSCSPQTGAADHELAKLLHTEPGVPLLLSVGNTMARKRLDVLLRVFASVRTQFPDLRLVRVGGLTVQQQQLARELGILDAITVLPFLERELLAAMYRRATLLLQTSEAEGFGLPVVEAMACGCPVAASDIPILREVADAAATYCPVGDVEGWSRTVARLLRESMNEPDAWWNRREPAIQRAARFSWAENARQTVAIYRMLAERQAVAQ